MAAGRLQLVRVYNKDRPVVYNTPLPGLLSIYRVKMSSVQIPVKYGPQEEASLDPPRSPLIPPPPFDRLLFGGRARARAA